jgi:phenylacetate-CoA ligase
MMKRDFSVYDRLDTADPQEVRKAQEELFREHLSYIASHSPYYRDLFSREGISAAETGLEGIGGLPFTDKASLEERNDDFLAVGPESIGDIVLSSGTTGRPTRMMYSDADLDRLAYNEKAAMQRLGIGPGDVALLTCTMDRCFIAGLAYYAGIRAVGAAAVRNGVNTPQSHMEVIKRMDPTVLVGVPSFLLKLGQYMKGEGMDPGGVKARTLICIGEPLRSSDMEMQRLGVELEGLWNAKAYSTYASSETVTTFCECEAQAGGHLHPALGIVEIVDEEGRPLPNGEAGEVVMTPLMMEGMPLLRFRTGDVSFLVDGRCGCGRTTPRLGPVIGRMKQMIKCHGTTLYPPAVFAALDDIDVVGEYFMAVDSDYELSDKIEVHVAVTDPACSSAYIAEKLQARLRVRPVVVIEPEEDLKKVVYDPASRKPIRYIDRRGK